MKSENSSFAISAFVAGAYALGLLAISYLTFANSREQTVFPLAFGLYFLVAAVGLGCQKRQAAWMLLCGEALGSIILVVVSGWIGLLIPIAMYPVVLLPAISCLKE